MLGHFLNSAISIARKSRSQNKPAGYSRVAIIMPGSKGSLGDEAMLLALVQELTGQGCREVTLVVRKSTDRWEGVSTKTTMLSMEKFYIYGSRLDMIKFALACRKVDHVFIIGADALDGFYNENVSLGMIQLARLGAELGVPTTIVGFSINESPKTSTMSAIRNLPNSIRVLCREPVSLERLSTGSARSFELSADIAFLLNPRHDTDIVRELSEWVEWMREHGKTIVAINISHLFVHRGTELPPKTVVAAYADAIEKLSKSHPECSLLLIPHDCRGEFSDVNMAKWLFELIPERSRKFSMVAPILTAPEVKAVVGQVDVAFSGRMHLAIACLGQCIPVGCVEYQGKFKGLLDTFGVAELRMSVEDLLDQGRLFEMLCLLVDRREELRGRIIRALPDIRRRASLNLEPAAQVDRTHYINN